MTAAAPASSAPTSPRFRVPAAGWPAAITWGVTAAVLHRVVLMIWLPLVWSLIGGAVTGSGPDFHTERAGIAPLASPTEQIIFGVWRRWDVVHYLDLALNGYRADHPGPTVFGPLTPAGIALAHAAVPQVDLAAALFETVAFAAALAFLFRLCETYYRDAALARWAVVITCLLPLSFFFAAPMSESPYLALALAAFYFSARGRWLAAGLTGFLAALTRSQGVLLLLPAVILLPQQVWVVRQSAAANLGSMLRSGWPLALIPLGLAVFLAGRAALGLPALTEIYTSVSYRYFTTPVDGLLSDLRWLITKPNEALPNLDTWMLGATLALAVASLFFRSHRRLPLQVYTWSLILLFLSAMNWYYGTTEPYYTQSIGRYALTLFPLAVLLADGIRHSGRLLRVLLVALMTLLMLFSAALYALALAGP